MPGTCALVHCPLSMNIRVWRSPGFFFLAAVPFAFFFINFGGMAKISLTRRQLSPKSPSIFVFYLRRIFFVCMLPACSFFASCLHSKYTLLTLYFSCSSSSATGGGGGRRHIWTALDASLSSCRCCCFLSGAALMSGTCFPPSRLAKTPALFSSAEERVY